MPRPRTGSSLTTLDRNAQRFRELRQQLQLLEYFCKGTVLERRIKCGKPGCACHADASKRHGPYWELTYKNQGKTVNLRLSPEAGPIYKAASQQHRKLKSLLSRLERLSRTALASLAQKAQAEHKAQIRSISDST
jgi:type II secretory pathway component PulJ